MDPQNNKNYGISNSSSLHMGMNEEVFKIPRVGQRNATVESPQFVATSPVPPVIGNPQTPQAHFVHPQPPQAHFVHPQTPQAHFVHPQPQFVHEENNAKLKNIFVLSIGFIFLYTGYNGQSVISTELMNEDTIWLSDARDYYWISIIVGAVFLPTYLIRKFMAKRVILVSMLIYVLYIALLSYPRNYTIIPCSILLGLSTATLWTATYFYIATVGNRYASARNDNSQAVTVLFLGIFFLFYQTKTMWMYVLIRESNLFQEQDGHYIFSGIFVAFAVAGVLAIALFMDPIQTRYVENQREGVSAKLTTVIDLGFASLLQLANNPYQLFIIPMTIWAGIDQGIILRRVAPNYEIYDEYGHYYFLACFIASNGIASIAFGPLIRSIGRIPNFTFVALLNLGTFIYFHLSDVPEWNWETQKQDLSSLYAYVVIWGITSALWTTQLIGLYAVLFSNNLEPAFSNYTLWTTVGHFIFYHLVPEGGRFAKSSDTFFWIHVVVLVAGMTGYYVIEVKERRKSHSLP